MAVRPVPSRTGWLTPINPFLKMGLSMSLVILSLFLHHLLALAVLVGGLGLLLISTTVPPVLILYGLLGFGLFTLTSVAISRDWAQSLFGTLRLLAILLPGPVLAQTTPPADLIRALQKARLPGFLSLSLMLIWRFFPLMQQELQRIWDANQLRGVDLRRRPGQWFTGLMVPLVFQMVAYAEDVTIGLQTRGYAPAAPRSNSQPLRWRWADTLFCLGTVCWLGSVGYLEWGR